MKQVIDEDGTTRQHCMRTIHAEQNAICQAARYGIPLEGTALFCKMEPCRTCAMLIISVGITKVIAQRCYHAAQETREMFKAAGVELVVIEDETETYENQ
jgi:dCMP deaminase